MSGRAESHEHNGPDGPSNDRTGSNAVNTPETPGTPTPGDTPPASEPAEGTPAGAAPAPSPEDAARPPATDTPARPPADGDGADGDGTAPDAARDGTADDPGAAEAHAADRDGTGRDGTDRDGTAPDAAREAAGGRAAGRDGAGTDPIDVLGLLGHGHEDEADGLDGDEAALRRLLHGAVDGLEPSTGALDHLRRAVPARRARKRQALVGTAAAVILLGTGVPAFVHVATSGGGVDANPVNAGHGAEVQGGTSGLAGEQAAGNPSGEPDGSRKDGADPSRTPSSAGTSASDGTDGTPGRGASAPAALQACRAEQLGVSVAEAGAPGGDGAVYGTFRIANVSSSDCTVATAGTVGFATSGAADPGRVSVVRHTDGDAASGLPGSSETVGSLVLKPSGAYEVRFAWVPSESCPVDGGSGGGSGDGGDGGGNADGGGGQSPEPTPSTPSEEPPPTAGGTATGSAEGGADTGTAATEPQLMRAEGDADGGVSVTYTPGAGGPQAVATISGACAGTIYRTGLLPAG
ncbi:hypothetical protein [Streptomyces roseolilacinus]|uniref:DUF4232 domain-containing protein n=1 Tax=Streptomyces roseolilacinus TaxID=66904 RepID=A0A918B1E8_9ACTN|nr:hypothetical protein [Streptomyces roseolilacinus]GGQ13940.1 hypothetical protein GCM10010249_36020 [Streptomyces roseolilacinus]